MPHKAWHQRSSVHVQCPTAARFHDTRSNLYAQGHRQRRVSILVFGASEDATSVDDAYLETILGDAAGRTPKQLSVSTSSRLCQSHHICCKHIGAQPYSSMIACSAQPEHPKQSLESCLALISGENTRGRQTSAQNLTDTCITAGKSKKTAAAAACRPQQASYQTKQHDT